jgi:hypothetical protein
MALPGGAILHVLELLVGPLAQNQVKERMEKAIPTIVAEMKEKEMTPEHAALPLVIRDALFRFWHAVIPMSGYVADKIRDRQEKKVKALALEKLGAERGLEQVVEATLAALLDVTF